LERRRLQFDSEELEILTYDGLCMMWFSLAGVVIVAGRLFWRAMVSANHTMERQTPKKEIAQHQSKLLLCNSFSKGLVALCY
jgi:hypothetical protein